MPRRRSGGRNFAGVVGLLGAQQDAAGPGARCSARGLGQQRLCLRGCRSAGTLQRRQPLQALRGILLLLRLAANGGEEPAPKIGARLVRVRQVFQVLQQPQDASNFQLSLLGNIGLIEVHLVLLLPHVSEPAPDTRKQRGHLRLAQGHRPCQACLVDLRLGCAATGLLYFVLLIRLAIRHPEAHVDDGAPYASLLLGATWKKPSVLQNAANFCQLQ
mmetsp:Transcript_26011/g.62017  ORF Transcript_26011/g.62017 Transcript_26011/m.62017 type:complete len:216 (-) Transcript_26011:317-964(-)